VFATILNIWCIYLYTKSQTHNQIIFFIIRKVPFDQSLIGSVVIDAEFGRKNHGSIPRNCDQKEAETT
jgi:hypothetical protein